MGDLSENFSRSEFACKCGCGLDSINIGIAHRIQLIRDIVRVPIKINSGCRCLNHNESVGGGRRSFHTVQVDGTTWAVDWSFYDDEDGLMEKLCTKLLDNWSGGFHYYRDQNFCHCDIGPRRRW